MGEITEEIAESFRRLASDPRSYALSYYGESGGEWSSRNIAKAILYKEDAFERFLGYADSYGMLDTLVSLTLFVDSLDASDITDWYHEKLKKLDGYELITQVADKFKKDYSFSAATGEEFDYFNDYDLIGVYSCIWENLNSTYKDSISPRDDKVIGIWHLGIYDYRNNEDYISDLDKKVLPYLLIRGNELKNYRYSDDKTALSIYKTCLFDYVKIALGHLDENLDHVINQLLNKDTIEVAELSGKGFQNIINDIASKHKHKIYVSKSFVSQLDDLISLVEYFGGPRDSIEISSVKSMMPLYYLFLGENEEAYDRLLSMALSNTVKVKWTDEYVIALYRSLLVTADEEKRKRLMSAFDAVYTNRGSRKEYLEVVNNISEFYLNWTKRIKAGYTRHIMPTKFHVFCEEWVINDKISNRFEEIMEELNSPDKTVVGCAENDATSLIRGLTMFEDTAIRINSQLVEKAFHDKKYSRVWNEIDGKIYDDDELKIIVNLKKKLENVNHYYLADESVDTYSLIKEKVNEFWSISDSELLCRKVVLALRGIQSDPINMWRSTTDEKARLEDSLNNLVAYFLRGYYGVERIQRENPEGVSPGGKKAGELDVTVMKDGNKFAIIEALRLLKLDADGNIAESDKNNIYDHLKKSFINYDFSGVRVHMLIVYAYVNDGDSLYSAMEDHLKESLPDILVNHLKVKASDCGELEEIKEEESSICHHKLEYFKERQTKEVHVFTVLLKNEDEDSSEGEE